MLLLGLLRMVQPSVKAQGGQPAAAKQKAKAKASQKRPGEADSSAQKKQKPND